MRGGRRSMFGWSVHFSSHCTCAGIRDLWQNKIRGPRRNSAQGLCSCGSSGPLRRHGSYGLIGPHRPKSTVGFPHYFPPWHASFGTLFCDFAPRCDPPRARKVWPDDTDGLRDVRLVETCFPVAPSGPQQ
eukprot:gene13712-biopygen5045